VPSSVVKLQVSPTCATSAARTWWRRPRTTPWFSVSKRQPAQGRADREGARVGVARQVAALEQLGAQAVRGGLRQAQAQRQLGERERAALGGQQTQQAQAALGGGAGTRVEFGVGVGRGGLGARHRGGIWGDRNIVFRTDPFRPALRQARPGCGAQETVW
jgi:hypothetical protein